MAHFNQEKKRELTPTIKAVLKKYGMKGTISVSNCSTLIVTLKSGNLDVLGARKKDALNKFNLGIKDEREVQILNRALSQACHEVNPSFIREFYADDAVCAFFTELRDAMRGPNYFDKSDMQTDYFHCAHYIHINVGTYGKPYICLGKTATFQLFPRA